MKTLLSILIILMTVISYADPLNDLIIDSVELKKTLTGFETFSEGEATWSQTDINHGVINQVFQVCELNYSANFYTSKDLELIAEVMDVNNLSNDSTELLDCQYQILKTKKILKGE